MHRATFACFALFVVLCPSAHSQVVSDPPPANHLLSVEMIHPNFKDIEDVSLLTGAYFIGGRFSLRPNVLLIAELPYSVIRLADNVEAANSSAVGNPYLGIAATRQNCVSRAVCACRWPAESSRPWPAC
jgi:hypothetical protein